MVEYLLVTTDKKLGKRGAENRLRLARLHGRLEAPEKGWLIVVGDEPVEVPVAAPAARQAVSRPAPAVLARPTHATVITTHGPDEPAHLVEVAAQATPETTTALCTVTAPASLPPADPPLLEQVEERAAILEFDGGVPREVAERLALEMVMGRPASGADAVVETVGVDHAVLAARMHPLVDHAVRLFGGTVRLISPEEDPFSTGWRVRASASRPADDGCRCGSSEFADVPIHGGRSARRECAGCGKFQTFSRWYGQWINGCGPPADEQEVVPDAAPPPCLTVSGPMVGLPVVSAA